VCPEIAPSAPIWMSSVKVSIGTLRAPPPGSPGSIDATQSPPPPGHGAICSR
jgi:hypothetical protein